MAKQNQGISPEMIAKAKEAAPNQNAPSPEANVIKPGVPDTLKINEVETTEGKKVKTPLDLVGKISIRPYVEADSENMGLEQYGFVIFPGTAQEEQLAAIERNGITRYVTGLDENAPEVINIKDDEERAAVVRNIRTVVAELEKRLASNIITDLEDKEFINKVKLLRPDNIDFWSKITIRCGNEPTFLNPKQDSWDLIKLMAIEAGGFSLVAKSYEDAKAQAVAPKFYLDKEIDTVSTRTQYKKLKNKAISILDKLYGENPKKLFYVTKVAEVNATSYKRSTPIDVLYDQMDEYISGNSSESNKARAAQSFIDISKLDMETLKIKALVKDASFYNFISAKPDGMIYHNDTGSMLGRNVSDVVLHLKNPTNEDILVKLMTQVENFWNQ